MYKMVITTHFKFVRRKVILVSCYMKHWIKLKFMSYYEKYKCKYKEMEYYSISKALCYKYAIELIFKIISLVQWDNFCTYNNYFKEINSVWLLE